MLQTLKKQNYNFSFFNKFILTKSLVAIFATGLFAVDINSYLSHEKEQKLLLKPIKNLNDEEYDRFILGRSFFTIPWVEAPSATTARDGLGPLFNANSCVSCHTSNGRGNLLEKDGGVSRALLAKLSLDENNPHKNRAFISEPNYGNQIATNGNSKVPYEGKIDIKFEKIKVIFADKKEVILEKPNYELYDLQYGKLDKKAIISYRLAPSLNGMALISMVEDSEILKNVDEFDKNSDGISGKANMVYSLENQKFELGRYGWKASISSLKQQIADASFNDMGITTTLFPYENCTSTQKECLDSPKARDKIDLPNQRLEALEFYLKNIKTYSAKKDENYKKGLKIFEEISCSKCHLVEIKTKYDFEINPFSDFLLHDMGDDLGDRVEFEAQKNEFRTAPLWGLALHEKINNQKPRLLHDGRAKSFEEAILWHGGEAKKSKIAYMNLEKSKREELIKFLEEL